jgi:hypothetical protein
VVLPLNRTWRFYHSWFCRSCRALTTVRQVRFTTEFGLDVVANSTLLAGAIELLQTTATTALPKKRHTGVTLPACVRLATPVCRLVVGTDGKY